MVVRKVPCSVTVPQNGALVHAHDEGRNLRGATKGHPASNTSWVSGEGAAPWGSLWKGGQDFCITPTAFFVLFAYLVVSVIHAGEMIP